MNEAITDIAMELLKIAKESENISNSTSLIPDSDQLILNKKTDMTHIRFVDWLNSKFKKKSGKEFTAQDAYGYVTRGNLPYHFGLYKLYEIIDEEIGIKIIRVEELNT